ncbi:hypothetical protein A2U01_0107301, partial [Trifolium medium]|nr:hypothetical protein [Trifolium medium]
MVELHLTLHSKLLFLMIT